MSSQIVSNRGEMVIFSGNSNLELAERIAESIGQELGKVNVSHFKDGEISVEIKDPVRGKDVFIVQSTSAPTNNNLMELLIMIDACKRASAGYVNVVVPYYGYARQDRKTRGREPITSKLVANLMTVAGADRVITVDLHAGQIQGYFDIPVDHFSAVSLLAKYFRDKYDACNPDKNFVVVSPDLGGVTRARNFANYLKCAIAIIEKRRPRPNVSEVMNVIGDYEGKNCILVDDMIDTAGTITNAANFLAEHGAGKIYIAATHGVLSGDAVEKITNSKVEEVVFSDTIYIPQSKRISKISQISMAPLLGEAMRRIHTNESISGLFEEI
ncbi:MAG: ribose-phosphate pyrophosphokinase [Peptoniphilaceae bacterium]|nr:ribose-phosphate pyrophosphokinase [Peptoniphilaceae bacterium]MDD7383354.1 ribose-phosphate pyrophosphokinase [Peptoniphilaceae bacterium]MDY3738275.1 ribose-phosphate pyrophosphokinase [Peptoniphilaceae bacterium]